MCVATLSDGEFDPELCPMLAGLSAKERAKRLEQPWVKACIDRRKARSESGASLPAVPTMGCSELAAEAKVEHQPT